MSGLEEKKQKILKYYLKEFVEILGNRGCNDVPGELWEDWTKEERQELVKAMHIDNGDPEEYNPEFLDVPDFWLVEYLVKDLISRRIK